MKYDNEALNIYILAIPPTVPTTFGGHCISVNVECWFAHTCYSFDNVFIEIHVIFLNHDSYTKVLRLNFLRQ